MRLNRRSYIYLPTCHFSAMPVCMGMLVLALLQHARATTSTCLDVKAIYQSNDCCAASAKTEISTCGSPSFDAVKTTSLVVDTMDVGRQMTEALGQIGQMRRESNVYGLDTPEQSEYTIAELVASMSFEDKLTMVYGSSRDTEYRSGNSPRLYIDGMGTIDGPNGARGEVTNDNSYSMALPVSIGMGNTWNVDLIRKAGRALGMDANLKMGGYWLAPMVNMIMFPWSGRSWECFSEDPTLQAKLGAEIIKGVQSQGVAAAAKHYIANELDWNRNGAQSVFSEQTLREYLLPPFEAAVVDAKVMGIMASYNHICIEENANKSACPEAGTVPTKAPTSKYLLTDLLKDELRFNGTVMTDWLGYGEADASANAGLDLQMPGSLGLTWEFLLKDFVDSGVVPESRVDDMVTRNLRVQQFTGSLDTGYTDKAVPNYSPDKTSIKRISKMVAQQSMVLMKNDAAFLPLQVGAALTLIGVPWRHPAVAGGGSSTVRLPLDIISPMAAIEAYAGPITFELGQFLHGQMYPPMGATMDVKSAEARVLADGKVVMEFPTSYRNDDIITATIALKYADPTARLLHEVIYTLTPYETGHYVGAINVMTETKLEFRPIGGEWVTLFDTDGKLLTDYVNNIFLIGIAAYHLYTPKLSLQNGIEYEFRHTRGDTSSFLGGAISRFASFSYPLKFMKADVSTGMPPFNPVSSKYEDPASTYLAGENEWTYDKASYLADATAAAAAAKAVGETCLIAVGSNSDVEAEGLDRFHTPGLASSGATLSLPQGQDALVDALLDANEDCIVVLNVGSVVEMPWYDKAKTVVYAGFFGNRGAEALADVLYGKTSFSGKSSVSWPKNVEDVPGYADYTRYVETYAGDVVSEAEEDELQFDKYQGQVEYKEGIFYGYKGYDKSGVAVNVPFGHGLSYTTFEHSDVAAVSHVDHTCDISFSVTNTGSRSGMEVSQVYVTDLAGYQAGHRPAKELRDFAKTPLAAGQGKHLQMTLPFRAFARWDSTTHAWVSDAGSYEVHVGASSAGPFKSAICSFAY